jgi:hypothetical protein
MYTSVVEEKTLMEDNNDLASLIRKAVLPFCNSNSEDR